jgi:cytoskeletal protein CcmA (bactofilin family)
MSVWPPLALTAATTAMLALPLTPALREIYRRADAAPLPTRTDDGNIRNFTHSFRRYIEPMLPSLSRAGERGETVSASLSDGAPALLIGAKGAFEFSDPEVDAVVLCADDIFVPPSVCFVRDVYVRGRLVGGANDVFRALLVDGDAVLAEQTILLRWMHSHGRLQAGDGSQFFGRVSADSTAHLGYGCQFERVNAPAVFTALDEIPESLAVASEYGKRSIIDCRFGRLRAGGELHLGPGDTVLGNIIARGNVRIDEDAHVAGSVKSHGRIEIASGSRIDGSVTSNLGLSIAGRCRIRGPVLCERDLTIGRATQIGSVDNPTTVSAARIRIAPGSVVYGTLWARQLGEVTE